MNMFSKKPQENETKKSTSTVGFATSLLFGGAIGGVLYTLASNNAKNNDDADKSHTASSKPK